ncbi:MAG: hypothetical protein JST58_07175 [Bacteroidetes bacterium]|nr:hypothetical protein [Bacteroidota bacterium]
MLTLINIPNLLSAQGYIDGRPQATKRINKCIDFGIVLKYGDGPDSCDVYGAREANVNKVNDTYYLFYDGAGKDGWKSCLAESKDLIHWIKKGAILNLGKPGSKDAKSASSPWVIKEGKTWHMFYLGTPNTSPAPDRVPSFPYLTMKAKSNAIEGPWVKQYNVIAFSTKQNSYYSVTASPGFIVSYQDKYVQFFSGASEDSSGTKRTLGIATTNNLDSTWSVSAKPIFPITEQVENSSIYYDDKNKTWYLFTNHIGIDTAKEEYTDAIWMYWSKDIYHWDPANKAIILDRNNCTWSKGAIGMPSVIKVGEKLSVLYDAVEGNGTTHMKRNIGLAWIDLPLKVND